MAPGPGRDRRRDRYKQFYHESYAGWGGTYVEDPSSLDSMWLIFEAMVTRAHSSCAKRSASSASLAACAALGFRRDGGAFLRETFLRGLGISTGGGCTFFFLRNGSFLFGGGGGFEMDRGSPINLA